MPNDIYCVDSSSLIALRPYPSRLFPGVWRELEALIQNQRLIAPREVLAEIKIGTDELLSWAKKNRKMFRELDQTQIVIVKEIMGKFPDRFDLDKEIPEADPFVLALAIATQTKDLFSAKCLVVTEEKPTKLPFVCVQYDIECIRILDLFQREQWSFS